MSRKYGVKSKDGYKGILKICQVKKATNDLPQQMHYKSNSADSVTDIANLFDIHFSLVYNEPTTSAHVPDFLESNSYLWNLSIIKLEGKSAVEAHIKGLRSRWYPGCASKKTA